MNKTLDITLDELLNKLGKTKEDSYRFGRLRYSWKAIDACRRFR